MDRFCCLRASRVKDSLRRAGRLAVLVVFLVIVTYVPQLSLWLPERLF